MELESDYLWLFSSVCEDLKIHNLFTLLSIDEHKWKKYFFKETVMLHNYVYQQIIEIIAK